MDNISRDRESCRVIHVTPTRGKIETLREVRSADEYFQFSDRSILKQGTIADLEDQCCDPIDR